MSGNRTSRRSFMTRCAALLPAVWAAPVLAAVAAETTSPASTAPAAAATGGPFTLAPLPYAANALEPVIDEQTMLIHHGKHHAAYVANLNKAVAESADLKGMQLEEMLRDLAKLPEGVRNAVRNNGGGHWNHTLFWELMTPGGAREPQGDLAKAIESTFGGFDKFREAFEDAGAKRFGSGWVWLVRNRDDKLQVVSTANQDTPISEGHHVILGNDVWEHAYYLKYQNRRADYLKAWWSVVNWDKVSARFTT